MRKVIVRPGAGGRIATGVSYDGAYVFTGEYVTVEEVDLDKYVNVQMTDGTSYEWTYRDPSEQLDVGDLVEVPFGYDNRSRIAKVVSLGKGYDGPYPIKDVTAVLRRAEL